MKFINGREIAARIKDQVKKEVQSLASSPSLHVIAVGDSELAQIFLREKEKACRKAGINFENHPFPATTKTEEITSLIQILNANPQATGVLVQLPLPPQSGLDLSLLDQIDPQKDVDCLTPLNFGRFVIGKPSFLPPTAQAVDQILKKEKISLKGKKATVVGAGRIAGLPIAVFLLQQGATVTVCHEFTQNLSKNTLKADLIVSAAGQPGLIKKPMVQKGAIVIDVGTSWVEDKIVGDVDLSSLESVAAKATPVPGGIGPIMIASLLKNILQAHRQTKN